MPLVVDRPVISLISDELFARLETLVSVPNDGIVIVGVVRPTRIGNYTPTHLLIVQTKGESVRVPESDCPGNPPAVAYSQTFNVRCHIAPSEKDPTPVERYEEVIEAAIHKAVRNTSLWHRFAGQSFNAEIMASEMVTGEGGYEGINVPVVVTYRHDEGNPYNVRA